MQDRSPGAWQECGHFNQAGRPAPSAQPLLEGVPCSFVPDQTAQSEGVGDTAFRTVESYFRIGAANGERSASDVESGSIEPVPGDRRVGDRRARAPGDGDVEPVGDRVGEVVVGERRNEADRGVGAAGSGLDEVPVTRGRVGGDVNTPRDPLEPPLRDMPTAPAVDGVAIVINTPSPLLALIVVR